MILSKLRIFSRWTTLKSKQLRYLNNFNLFNSARTDVRLFLSSSNDQQLVRPYSQSKNEEQETRNTHNVNYSLKKAIRNNVEERRRKLTEKRELIVEDLRKTKEKVKEIKDTVDHFIETENIFTIPNVLSVSRIALTPYLGYLVLNEHYTLACCGLIAIAITDVADGWIARTWRSQSSKLGSFLDPMADKILIGTMVLTLTYNHLIPLALTALIIFRDVGLITAALVIRYISLPKPKTLSAYFDVSRATAQLTPTTISKINTFIQLVLVGSSIAAPVFGYVDSPYLHCMWYITGASTIAGGMSYLLANRNTYKIFSDKK